MRRNAQIRADAETRGIRAYDAGPSGGVKPVAAKGGSVGGGRFLQRRDVSASEGDGSPDSVPKVLQPGNGTVPYGRYLGTVPPTGKVGTVPVCDKKIFQKGGRGIQRTWNIL